jgi:hypothetical protein
MQEANELGKYVTDGKHVYPYNMFLDEDLKSGKLTYCDKPTPRPKVAREIPTRTALRMTLDERTALAEKFGVSVGDLGNMSPQELAAAEANLQEQQQLESSTKV